MNETAGNETIMNRTLKAILLSAGLCSLPNLCFSAIVYDNTSTNRDLGGQYRPSPTTLEFGDQINLLSGPDRTLSQFSFYYSFSGATASTQRMTLRMYLNNGSTNQPSTMFYQSDPIALNPGQNTETITFPLSSNLITLPNTFTWTVQFSSLGATETGGLLLYGPPTVGSSFNDFWLNEGANGWNLRQISGGTVPADFAARVSAVPEPGVLALGALGALFLAGLKRFRKAPA